MNLTIKTRTKNCRFGDECTKLKCPYIHISRDEKYGDKIDYEIPCRIKVCYNFIIPKCNLNRYCKNLDCQFYHRFYDYKKGYVNDKSEKQFELMKREILYDKNVVKNLPELFVILNFLR